MAIQYRFPHISVSLPKGLTATQRHSIELIAGNRFMRNGKLILPHHSVENTAELIGQMGLKIMDAAWRQTRTPPRTWLEHANYLGERGEIRDWVLDGFLTEFQMDAIEKTGTWKGAHFWHPTGAGKTLSGILWALLTPGPIVIVTRAASRLQYGREIERFTHLDPYVVRPLSKYTKKQRAKMQTLDEYVESCRENKERIVIVIGWEVLTTYVRDLCDLNPSSVIFDESHRGKNSKRWEAVSLPIPNTENPKEMAKILREQEQEARRRGGFIADPDDPKSQSYNGPDRGRAMIVPAQNTTSAASSISKAAQRVLCTTATPIKDRVRDLWAQLDLAEPYAWGSKTNWMKRYCDAKPGAYGGMDTRGQSNLNELSARLEYVIHRIDYRDTHRHLPEKRRQSVYVAPEDQCRASAGFPKEMKAASKRGASAVLEVRLAEAASKKRKAIMGLVKDHIECGHKVIIFSGRRRDVDNLGESIRKLPLVKKKDMTVWAAHGGVDGSERQQIVDDYMDHPGPCVLVGTGHAFGESLNLQDTDAALFTMLPYTPGQLRQWEGRFTRLGQKRPVVIYYCIAEGTADERIADILIAKMPAVAKIAQDEELAEAKDVIGGLDDPDALAESILSKL